MRFGTENIGKPLQRCCVLWKLIDDRESENHIVIGLHSSNLFISAINRYWFSSVIHAMTPLPDDKKFNSQNQELCIILVSYCLASDTKINWTPCWGHCRQNWGKVRQNVKYSEFRDHGLKLYIHLLNFEKGRWSTQG